MSGRPLLLVPTEMESARLPVADDGPFDVALLGVGPIAAAARTATLLGAGAPSLVVLVGIAGTYREDLYPVGSASAFGSVAIDGVGAGAGSDFRTAPQIGFPYWPGDAATRAIEDVLPLRSASDAPALLTVCASAGDRSHVDRRRARWPHAVAEDMEAWGAAFACAMAGVSLAVVRGASNVAGDRDHARWRIDAALAAAWKLAAPLLGART